MAESDFCSLNADRMLARTRNIYTEANHISAASETSIAFSQIRLRAASSALDKLVTGTIVHMSFKPP